MIHRDVLLMYFSEQDCPAACICSSPKQSGGYFPAFGSGAPSPIEQECKLAKDPSDIKGKMYN